MFRQWLSLHQKNSDCYVLRYWNFHRIKSHIIMLFLHFCLLFCFLQPQAYSLLFINITAFSQSLLDSCLTFRSTKISNTLCYGRYSYSFKRKHPKKCEKYYSSQWSAFPTMRWYFSQRTILKKENG